MSDYENETAIIEAILVIKNNAQVTVEEDDIDMITWHDGNPTNITKEQILAKQVELRTEYNANTYARKRKEEYPPIGDFMEAYTEKEIGGDSTKWDAYIVKYNKVRTDNPK
jgi:hypothetical protein|tara:strand:+ start:234 stop:566 length:333 start_codon:yes stop_codon:yes gene_type:complete